jgi:hypothetical protein
MRNAKNSSGPSLDLTWIGWVNNQDDWLNFVLGEEVGTSSVVPSWPEPRPHTLYCVDTNWFPLKRIPKDFLAACARTPGVGLFHSDEWLIEDYNIYSHFAYVLRVHRAAAIAAPGIMTLPLGWPNGGQGPDRASLKPATERQYSWFFAGNLFASRPAMLAAMLRVPNGQHLPFGRPQDALNTRLSPEDYRAVVAETIFIPSGMGNVVAETWRTYEALEAGCIPLLEKRWTMDYYRELLGPHPIPTFRNWSQAASFARDLLHRPADLLALQQEIILWWDGKKQQTRQSAQAFVRHGAQDGWRDSMRHWHFKSGKSRDLWQYGELLRHQSLGSLRWRLGKMLKRGSLRRDESHLDQLR